jgi:plastocyanin
MRRIGFCVVALALAATACASKAKTAQTFGVLVDAKSDAFNISAFAYFPNELKVHAGDTVKFTSVFRGEPHTVTFGTLVDAAVKAFKANPEAEEGAPEAKKLPDLLPEGPGDAVQAAAQPCFLATGDPPASDPCSADQQKQPALTGTQTYFNSGWLDDDQTFTVSLADSVASGEYFWMCLLHREFMNGSVTVVAQSETADRPADMSKRGIDLLSEFESKLQPVLDQVKGAPLATPPKVAAGLLVDEKTPAFVAEFVPAEVSIPVDGGVSWDVAGPHTISFNVPEDAKLIIQRAPDGAVHLVEKALGAAGPPGPPPGEIDKPTKLDGGSFDGNGYKSSGIILAFGPPGTAIYSVKFTTAGTYKYQCAVHVDMEGTVKVG